MHIRLEIHVPIMDRWFVSDALVNFVVGCKKKYHLPGMAKMGKTWYNFNDKAMTAKELVQKQKRNKKVKRSRKLNV